MVRLLTLALLGWITLVGVPAAEARTEAGDVLWQDTFDLAGGLDVANAVAASGGRVVAVGSVHNGVGNRDFVVRAYDGKSGEILWTDRVDVAGRDDRATAVVMDDHRAVVSGAAVDAAGNGQLVLRAYVPQTGVLAWEDRSPAAFVGGIAMDGDRIVALATTVDANGDARGSVRAYGAASGVLAWQNNFLPAGFASFASAGVALRGRTVFVAGTARPTDLTLGPHCVARAYDVRDGRLLWEDAQVASCSAQAIATDGRRVLVAGIGGQANDDYKVQAYDADTGAALWQDRTFVGTGFTNAAVAVDTEKRQAFVAGWVRWLPGRLNQEAFLVRAYDTETGVLRWEEQFPSAEICLCHAHDVVADKGRVFAVGQGPSRWLVRAFNAKRGDLLWSDDFAPLEAFDFGYDGAGALAVAVDGGKLFVAGSGVNTSGNADFILRAYDAK